MKLYCAVKIGEENEKRVRGYLEHFAKFGGFSCLELAKPDRLHVTTRFLGEIPEAQAQTILESASVVAPFDAFLGEPGSFGDRVLYLRAYGSGLTMVNRVQSYAFRLQLGRGGYEDYKGHLAIAKAPGREGSAFEVTAGINTLSHTPMMPFRVERVGLYHKSELLSEVKLEGHPGLAKAGL